jgi:N-acetylglutamate synthase-like GNAT family acetyltransferase
MPLDPAVFTVSTRAEDVDRERLFQFLNEESGWATGISREIVNRAVENSLNFTLLDADGVQRGYARVVTDRATFAWLCDVYVDADVRGMGLSHRLLEAVDGHPDMMGLRRWILATSTAPWLYEKYGWQPVARPDIWMERHRPYPQPS